MTHAWFAPFVHTIGLLYDRGQPAEAPRAWQLSRLCHLRPVTYDHVHRLARWVLRGAPPDPLHPPPIPLLPHLRWRGGLQGLWFRHLTRDCDTVIISRLDQAPLLRAVRDKRRLALLMDDDTYYGHTNAQERMLVANCDLILPVSQPLADRMIARTGAAREKFHVVPIGVNEEAVPVALPAGPVSIPALQSVSRPLAGILGGISPGRLRLDLVEQCAHRLPWLNWLIAGRIEWASLSVDEVATLRRLMTIPRCRFLEGPPYSQGWKADNPQLLYAAALDVALIPYCHHPAIEVASPARMFFHFAQGTPVISTTACRQLVEHAPLVECCDSADAMVAALERLRACDFMDQHRQARWHLARTNTTANRAREIIAHVESLFPSPR